VEHGVTGFLGESDAELAGFVREVGRIDRRACRRRAEERYSVRRMVADYESLYERLVERAE
jgi:glycosyltransferase involved in cell wall biosynthesis